MSLEAPIQVYGLRSSSGKINLKKSAKGLNVSSNVSKTAHSTSKSKLKLEQNKDILHSIGQLSISASENFKQLREKNKTNKEIKFATCLKHISSLKPKQEYESNKVLCKNNTKNKVRSCIETSVPTKKGKVLTTITKVAIQEGLLKSKHLGKKEQVKNKGSARLRSEVSDTELLGKHKGRVISGLIQSSTNNCVIDEHLEDKRRDKKIIISRDDEIFRMKGGPPKMTPNSAPYNSENKAGIVKRGVEKPVKKTGESALVHKTQGSTHSSSGTNGLWNQGGGGGGCNNNGDKNNLGLKGIRNIGNTCYMNSVLQCLSSTLLLLEYILSNKYLEDIKRDQGALTKAFAAVINELWAQDAHQLSVNPFNLKIQFQKFAPRYESYRQEDAQEFLRYLLEGIHEEINRIDKIKQGENSSSSVADAEWKRYLHINNSKIIDIFVGQLKSVLKCTVCGNTSVTYDIFWDLSLPIPTEHTHHSPLTLNACFDSFTCEEILDGKEKPYCSKCKIQTKSVKTFFIQRFPDVLVLHLKRFSTDKSIGKIVQRVEFPLRGLNLARYSSATNTKCCYDLYAVSNHSGTQYGGHYTAFCKHPYNKTWNSFDDSTVRVVRQDSELVYSRVVTDEAYLLFYELVK